MLLRCIYKPHHSIAVHIQDTQIAIIDRYVKSKPVRLKVARHLKGAKLIHLSSQTTIPFSDPLMYEKAEQIMKDAVDGKHAKCTS
jgi:hypothetical protein